jgi:hypothetical protein
MPERVIIELRHNLANDYTVAKRTIEEGETYWPSCCKGLIGSTVGHPGAAAAAGAVYDVAALRALLEGRRE